MNGHEINPGLSDSSSTTTSLTELKTVVLKLLAYCQAEEWKGYDPYDALNSEIFKRLPFLNSRIPRILLTQLFKRSPLNLRPLFRIPKTQNPKALALFLMAFVRLSRIELLDREEVIKTMADKLMSLRSADTPYWCWGYSFPWQTRTVLVPPGGAKPCLHVICC